ncbi:MAG: hypothetical protein EA379_05685 [Phycisphaerales bacterium]|nr:MAG: hypothetical protein EA379_05685 [Phycisphaerales bacterium]
MPPSPSQRPLVIQTERLDEAAAAWLEQRCELVVCDPADDSFGPLLARAHALVIRTYTRVDEALLERAPNLRVVGRAGVGLDNVDVKACADRGVTVVSTPDANTRAVIEYVGAAMLDHVRPRPAVERALPADAWRRLRDEAIGERQLSDRTLGIYGLGRVGTGVARLGAAFNMHVIYHDLLDIPEDARHGAEPVDRDTLLFDADILTIHVDGRAANRGLIDADAIRHWKDDILFINASRGFVVDAHALAEFLRASPEAGAVLDVHEPEPFGDDYPLLGLPNARLTPHIGAATETAHRNMSMVVRDVWRVLNGERPEHPASARVE